MRNDGVFLSLLCDASVNYGADSLRRATEFVGFNFKLDQGKTVPFSLRDLFKDNAAPDEAWYNTFGLLMVESAAAGESPRDYAVLAEQGLLEGSRTELEGRIPELVPMAKIEMAVGCEQRLRAFGPPADSASSVIRFAMRVLVEDRSEGESAKFDVRYPVFFPRRPGDSGADVLNAAIAAYIDGYTGRYRKGEFESCAVHCVVRTSSSSLASVECSSNTYAAADGKRDGGSRGFNWLMGAANASPTLIEPQKLLARAAPAKLLGACNGDKKTEKIDGKRVTGFAVLKEGATLHVGDKRCFVPWDRLSTTAADLR